MLYTVGKVLMSWVTFSKEHGSENQVFRSYFRFFVQNSDDVWIINDAVYAWGVHKLIQSVVYYQGLSPLILWIIESCPYLASGMVNKAPTGHLLPAPPANYEIFRTSSKSDAVSQSTRNFMLISKMYAFIYLSYEFLVFPKTGLFRPLNGHNSRQTQDRHTKVYIFEISVKFCVDWCTIYWHLSNFKFWYD